MPTYRSINIALHSQFDIETLPEYYPLPPSPSLDCSPNPSSAIPPHVDDATSTCSVHIPVLPGSQFWIVYSISPPVPEGHYFLFKLYIDGERVMNWSVGKGDGWMGKTMFGLFENKSGCDGDNKKSKIGKRVFCFSALGKESKARDGCVEIRVHRASGRRRVEREVDIFEETVLAKKPGGVSFVNAGHAGPEQPKRFYKFALIDPIDQPFATFRCYYRTWEQLRDLGLLEREYYTHSEDGHMSIIEPDEGSANSDSKRDSTDTNTVFYTDPKDVFQTDGDDTSVHDWSREDFRQQARQISKRTCTPAHSDIDSQHSSLRRNNVASSSYIPRGGLTSDVTTGSPRRTDRRESMNTYRLSIPPAIQFAAPEPSSRPLPLPQKTGLSSPTAYRPHPAYPAEESVALTLSPVRSAGDGIMTPPPVKRRGLSRRGAGWLDMLSSTWKRSVSGGPSLRTSEDDEGPRSVSC